MKKTKKAVIFDLDGTLLDSNTYHFKKHRSILKEFGIKITQSFFNINCSGTLANDFYRTIINYYKIKKSMYQKIVALKDFIYKRDRKEMDELKIFPGVKNLLKKLKKEGYIIALASSSPIKYVKSCLKINKIDNYFSILTSGDHVKRSKPSPEIFLNAWKKTGLKKSDCIIIEDSKNGVIAAKRAKIKCICILTTEKKKDIPKYAKIAKNHKELFIKINENL